MTAASTINEFKKRIRTEDFDTIAKAVDDISELDDPTIFDLLLDGVTAAREREWQPEELVPNKNFKGTKKLQPFLDHALRLTLAEAPEACSLAKKLKNELTSLRIRGRINKKTCAPVDLAPVAAFTEVKTLEIDSSSVVTNLGKLSHLPLEILTLAIAPLANNHDLAGIDRLVRLKIFADSSPTPFPSFRGFKKLERLAFEYTTVKTLEFLKGASNLTELSLEHVDGYQSLEGPEGLKKLTKLTLVNPTNLKTTEGMKALPKLEDIHAEGATALGDVIGLSEATNLRKLFLYDAIELTDVTPLLKCTNLSKVDLGSCDRLDRQKAIDTLKELPELDLAIR